MLAADGDQCEARDIRAVDGALVYLPGIDRLTITPVALACPATRALSTATAHFEQSSNHLVRHPSPPCLSRRLAVRVRLHVFAHFALLRDAASAPRYLPPSAMRRVQQNLTVPAVT